MESDRAVDAGIDGDDIEWERDFIPERLDWFYTGGEALDIGWAKLEVADQVHDVEVVGGEKGVVFTVDLPLGETPLFASFYHNKEQQIAPYYIYVRKV